METNYLIAGACIFIAIIYSAVSYCKNYTRCEEGIIRCLKLGFPMPVEILWGYYKVVSKLPPDNITLVRIYDGKKVAESVEIEVSERLFSRINDGSTYFFYFDKKLGEIHFDLDNHRNSEPSKFTSETMKMRRFDLKRSILEKLNR